MRTPLGRTLACAGKSTHVCKSTRIDTHTRSRTPSRAAVKADVDRSCLILETGVNQRWRYGGWRASPDSIEEAQGWEEAKEGTRCGGRGAAAAAVRARKVGKFADGRRSRRHCHSPRASTPSPPLPLRSLAPPPPGACTSLRCSPTPMPRTSRACGCCRTGCRQTCRAGRTTTPLRAFAFRPPAAARLCTCQISRLRGRCFGTCAETAAVRPTASALRACSCVTATLFTSTGGTKTCVVLLCMLAIDQQPGRR